MRPPYLKEMRLRPDRVSAGVFPYTLPFLRTGEFSLGFRRPVTILTGENGSGKSTLLEAIAVQCGFDAGGGGRNNATQMSRRTGDPDVDGDRDEIGDADDAEDSDPDSRAGSAYPLDQALRLSWLPKVTNGFFFRAETFHRFSTYIDQMARRWPMMRDAYGGGRDLGTMSHGESFLALFENRLAAGHRSLFLLDEPESALSPARQQRLLDLMSNWGGSHKTQIIMATHSPLLMSQCDAEVLLIDGADIRPVDFRETPQFRVMKAFFDRV